MRVCIEKATGKLLDGAQSGGETPPIDPKWTLAELEAATAEYRKQNLQTLIDNAVRQGYKPEDVEAKFVDDAEFAAITEKMKQVPTYADLRRAAYPPAADYLDGIVKGDQDQVKKYIEDCLAVKAKYPKP